LLRRRHKTANEKAGSLRAKAQSAKVQMSCISSELETLSGEKAPLTPKSTSTRHIIHAKSTPQARDHDQINTPGTSFHQKYLHMFLI
jgi:hypothetical protein